MSKETLIYLLTGKDDFLKEEKIKTIKSKLLNENETRFNYNVFYAKDTDGKSILEVAKSFPFISSYRLLVVRDVDKLNPSDKELLFSYIKNPNERTVLVLETSQENEKYFSNLVLKEGKIFCFRKLRQGEIRNWVYKRVSSWGKRIEDKAIDILVENIKDDLRSLSNAIDVLILYLGDRDFIGEEDVRALIGIIDIGSSFRLVEAIGAKDTPLALKLLSQLLNRGEKPPQILGLILWHWRRLWQAKECFLRAETKEEVGNKLGIKDYLLDRFLSQLDNFQLVELEKGFRYLLEGDTGIKRGYFPPQICLEVLMVKLCERHDKIFLPGETFFSKMYFYEESP